MKFQAAMDKGYSSVARHEQQVRQNFKQQWNAALSSEDNQYPQTRTLLGRKREWQPQPHQYPPINEALNAPIQGSGADMSKLAIALLLDALDGTQAKITLIRHDEIVLTAQESQAEKVGKILESVMKAAGLRITPDIPTVAEVSLCDNLAGERLSQSEFCDREKCLQSLPEAVQNKTLVEEPITQLRTHPKQAPKFKPNQQPLSSENTLTDFDIRDHVKFRNGRGECPCCGLEGKPNNLNLSVREDGLFWCFRGSGGEAPSRDVEQLHDEKAIRKALGLPEIGKVQVLPDIREFNQSQSFSENVTSKVATEEDLKMSQQRLLSNDDKHHSLQQKALDYLEHRGITPEMAQRYNIGLNFGFRTPDGQSFPASITFHHRDAVEPDKLYLRRRYAPWLSENELEPGTPKWGQSGVPPSVWVVQQPEQQAEKTYLTEGPWDAVKLGEAVRQSGESIAVACTSTGARGIPPPEQLKAIPGEEVVIFYDRFDEYNQGQIGAIKIAKALRDVGKQATVALVPRVGEVKKGWDISDAFDAGFTLEDIQQAEADAKQQQQWAKQVAEVVCDCLNQARTHHLEGSRHTAHWSKGDRKLTLMENDTEHKVLDVVWDEGWVNVDSHLTQEKVDYFVEEVQPRLQARNQSSSLNKEVLLR
jgi:hypothetical protein